ncbi:MAG TPA: hypothetical protein VD866_25195 [Urbifossiella sp.]|nr:hypothetical protein [Urbifossiella sp.]
MRGLMGVLAGLTLATVTASGQPNGVTPAAEETRSKLLKVKLSLTFNKFPLREALKEIAHLVNENTEKPILWTYAADGGVPNVPVTYNCKDKAVDVILDDLFKQHGLGFTVLSGDDHPRDGWVRVGPGKERGEVKRLGAVLPPEPEDPTEAAALSRLTAAKALLDQGKAADAKLILGVVIGKYGKTKAGAEAKDLLEKLNK